MFISFEGCEGSGKTTQTRLLANALRDLGHDVLVTREPGGSPIGATLREMVLQGDMSLSAVGEALLMTADRAEHVRQVIKPAIQAGNVVICDRYADSTLAYQGGGRGLDFADLLALQEFAIEDLWPELTILLDIDAEVGLERRNQAGDTNRIDGESLQFHQRVVAWYRQQASREPDRWRVIDADRPATEVLEDVLAHIRSHLPSASREANVEG